MSNPSTCNVKDDEKGYASKCKGCPMQAQCQEGKKVLEEQNQKIKSKLTSIKNIILVLSGKGGVGKSTIASQLAYGLAQDPKLHVGLLDIDICGPSIPHMLKLQNSDIHTSSSGWEPVFKQENLSVMSIGFLIDNKDDAIIWRGPRKNGLIMQFLTETNWGALDYLIIDTPPGTSDEHLSIVSYLKECNLKGAVIVTTPQEVSLADVRKEINFCVKTEVKIIGVVENMSGFLCPHCDKKSEIFRGDTGGATKMCEDYKLNLICKVPLDIRLIQASEKGEYYKEESESYKEMGKLIDYIKNN